MRVCSSGAAQKQDHAEARSSKWRRRAAKTKKAGKMLYIPKIRAAGAKARLLAFRDRALP